MHACMDACMDAWMHAREIDRWIAIDACMHACMHANIHVSTSLSPISPSLPPSLPRRRYTGDPTPFTFPQNPVRLVREWPPEPPFSKDDFSRMDEADDSSFYGVPRCMHA